MWTLGLVAFAFNSSEGIKVGLNNVAGPPGWVCWCIHWLARSKLAIGPRGSREGLGHLVLREGGHCIRLALESGDKSITSPSKQWKDNNMLLCRPI